jgi:hypothetical protein
VWVHPLKDSLKDARAAVAGGEGPKHVCGEAFEAKYSLQPAVAPRLRRIGEIVALKNSASMVQIAPSGWQMLLLQEQIVSDVALVTSVVAAMQGLTSNGTRPRGSFDTCEANS